MRTGLAIGLTFIIGLPALAEPAFAPRSEGLTHVYSGGWEHFVGGGLASFDCDGDRLPELYAAGGSEPASLLRNITAKRGGQLEFTEDTPEFLALSGVIGAYPLDIDGDALVDLAVIRVGENILLRGLGDCAFGPFEGGLGFTSARRWTTAFSATWEADASLPTLAFGNYVDRENPEGPFEACDTNLLYRPDDDAWGAPQELAPGFCPLSILFTDWSRSGQADLRVSNDRHYYVRGGQEQLWAMEAPVRLYGEQDGWQNYMIWGMGIASRDITGDGLPEIFLTSMGDQKMQTLDTDAGGPLYRDATYDRGTTAHRPYFGDEGRPSTGWHVAFGDVQNDGRDDVFIAKGNVEQMPSAAMKDPNNLLIQQQSGKFSEFGDIAGIATTDRSRGAVFEDLNLDGLIDLAVINRRAPIEIYQNVTEDTGNWLALALAQPAPNSAAIGAWIELDTGDGQVRVREMTVGGGHAGGSAGLQHFGLGGASAAQVRVIWPDGAVSDWQVLDVNQTLLLSRKADQAIASDY